MKFSVLSGKCGRLDVDVSKRFMRLREKKKTGHNLRELCNLAPVVRRVDIAIHWINHCPLDNWFC